MSEGSMVRIRRVTPTGGIPVRAVIEVDRRNSGPHQRGGGASPPPLMAVEGETEQVVVASLLPFAEEDEALSRLLVKQRQV
jgi:hypothetical protein